MATVTDPLTEALAQIRSSIRGLEKEIARGDVPDLYRLGRLQGRVMGLEEAQLIVEGRVESYLES